MLALGPAPSTRQGQGRDRGWANAAEHTMMSSYQPANQIGNVRGEPEESQLRGASVSAGAKAGYANTVPLRGAVQRGAQDCRHSHKVASLKLPCRHRDEGPPQQELPDPGATVSPVSRASVRDRLLVFLERDFFLNEPAPPHLCVMLNNDAARPSVNAVTADLGFWIGMPLNPPACSPLIGLFAKIGHGGAG